MNSSAYLNIVNIMSKRGFYITDSNINNYSLNLVNEISDINNDRYKNIMSRGQYGF